MKKRFILNSILLALLSASCAPVAVTTESPAMVEPSATVFMPPVEQATATEAVIVATEVPASTPLPIATSYGPNLRATDPSTVKLASGGLQLVEFIRFT